MTLTIFCEPCPFTRKKNRSTLIFTSPKDCYTNFSVSILCLPVDQLQNQTNKKRNIEINFTRGTWNYIQIDVIKRYNSHGYCYYAAYQMTESPHIWQYFSINNKNFNKSPSPFLIRYFPCCGCVRIYIHTYIHTKIYRPFPKTI